MAKTSLTDMERVILSGAAMRPDLKVLPVPKSLQKSNSAIGLSLKPLLAKGLIGEVPADREDAVWREDAEGGKLALVITAAGMEAIGVSLDGLGATGVEMLEENGGERVKTTAASGAVDAPNDAKLADRQEPRAGSKLAQLIATLRQPAGATIPDIMAVTGWQAHSIRGAMSGALKKKLGLHIASEPIEGRGRVYRIQMQSTDIVSQSPDGPAPDGDQGRTAIAPNEAVGLTTERQS